MQTWRPNGIDSRRSPLVPARPRSLSSTVSNNAPSSPLTLPSPLHTTTTLLTRSSLQMGWFSNLFSSDGANINARRKMAMSTHDAFSLPTSSPVHSVHQHDSFARYGSSTPDPDSSSHAPAYSYPPPSSSGSPTNYDYLPSLKCVFFIAGLSAKYSLHDR